MARKKPPNSHVLERGQRQKAQEEQKDTRRGRRTEPAGLYPLRDPDSKKLTHTKKSIRCDLAWAPGRVGVLGQSHWPDTKPSLREPRMGRAPAMRGVSAQHLRKSGSRRDALSLPACKSPTRSFSESGMRYFFDHNFVHSLSRVQRWHVARLALAQRGGNSRERSVRERAGCRRSGSWNGAGSWYLAECSLMLL